MSIAGIAIKHVIPTMQKSQLCKIHSIASRDETKAKQTANQFNIPNFYGSYDVLIRNESIDAVYIPLPNHLHVPWAIKALQAGKHVLVEKPIGMTSLEGTQLLNESRKYPHVKIMEAFMYRFHPQWVNIKSLINDGSIGELKTIKSTFTFFDDNPDSIVNKKEFGGGSLMDIGCYPVSLSRFLFDVEPNSVSATIDYDPIQLIDIHANCVLNFDNGVSTFVSSIRSDHNQSVKITGTEGTIKIGIPFNPPTDKPTNIWIKNETGENKIEYPICDQYTIQADLFSQSILNNLPVPTPLLDGIQNMKVLEKLHGSNNVVK